MRADEAANEATEMRIKMRNEIINAVRQRFIRKKEEMYGGIN